MPANFNKSKIELNLLGKCKDVIYKNLISNVDVCELVLGENNSTGNISDHFHSTLYLDTTKLEEKTYVSLDTKIIKSDNTNIKCIEILFDVFTAYPLVNLSSSEQSKYYNLNYYGNRIDVLIDVIKRSISDLNMGIGKITLAPSNPVKLIHPSDAHYGKRLEFQIYDF